jgi:hypothetical protein
MPVPASAAVLLVLLCCRSAVLPFCPAAVLLFCLCCRSALLLFCCFACAACPAIDAGNACFADNAGDADLPIMLCCR